MAAEQKHNRSIYATNGGAAYDIYTQDGARRLRELPREKAKPERQKRIKAKLTLAPTAMLGGVLAAVMLVMVIFGYVRLYEAKNQLGDVRQEATALQESNEKLRSVYESGIDLDAIEARALELGMQKSTGSQVVYVDVAVPDHAEITVQKQTNWLEDAAHAIKDGFLSLLEYFF